MALTNTTKNELLQLLMGKANLDSRSEILPKPSYKTTGDTNYISEFKKIVLNTSNESIKQVRLFENTKVVLIEYSLAGNLENSFVLFNDLNELTFVADEVTNLSSPVKLPTIYDFKISEEGIIFGFSNGIEDTTKDKVSFFIFNDILSLIGLLPETELKEETFFSAIFDVETEIKDPDDGTVIGGNPAFALIKNNDNKYGFNQDEKTSDTFGFVIWEKNTKDVSVVRFQTDVVNIDPASVDYEINEKMSLTGGNFGQNTFANVSVIDILTGNRSTDYKGSIVFSTQKDAGANVVVKQTQPITNTDPLQFDSKMVQVDDNIFSDGPPVKVVLVSNLNMQRILQPIKNIYNNAANTIIDSEGKLTFKTKYTQQKAADVNLPLTKDIIEEMINGNEVEFFVDIKYILGGTFQTVDFKWRIDNNEKLIKHYEFFRDGTKYEDIFYGDPSNYLATYASFDFFENINITFSRLQKVVQENVTSQILIQEQSSKNIYKIVQSENNSYEGTQPTFINSLKAFIPLKDKTSNKYSVYEFNGESAQQQQEIERDYIDTAEKTYTDQGTDFYTAELLDPTQLLNINVAGVDVVKKYIFPLTMGFIVGDINNPGNGNENSRVDITLTDFDVEGKGVTPGGVIEFTAKLDSKTFELSLKQTNVNGEFDLTLEQTYLKNSDDPVFDLGGFDTNLIKLLQNQYKVVQTYSDEAFTLSGNVVTLTGIKKDEVIIIDYKSNIGTPTKLHVDTSSSGSDMYITGVLDKKELGTVSRAIIGAGDDSDKSNGIDPTQVFGFNLYKDGKSIDYNQISEEVESLPFKVKHIVGARQNNVLFMTAYNEDFTKFISWIQIYPDAFKSYTYLSYSNPEKLFAIERLSINKSGERSLTVFDRDFIDVPSSGDTLTATTTAKTSDGNNQDNDKQIIYGQTNQPLFEYDKPLIKTSGESTILNFNITTEVKDLLNKDVTQPEASESLTALFADPNTVLYKGFVLDKFKVTYGDGSVVETSAIPFLKLDNDNQLIRVGITLYNKDVGQDTDKIPNKLELFNVAGQLMATVDLEDEECIGGLTDIGWDITVSDDPQPFATWSVNGWGERPWAPLQIAKGGK